MLDVITLVPSLSTSTNFTVNVLQQILFQMSLVLQKDISVLVSQLHIIGSNMEKCK